jgi:hypothetical protein
MSTSTAVERQQVGGISIDYPAVLKSLNLDPSRADTQALILVCDRYGLDPILKHAVLIKGNLYVTRDGLLNIAHRSGQFDGIEVIEQGETQTHYTAKVAVYRKDMGHPFTYIGRYPKNGGNKEFAPEMAVKVGEVMGLKRAFNVAVSTAEERWDVDPGEVVQANGGTPSASNGAQSTPPVPTNGNGGGQATLDASATETRSSGSVRKPPNRGGAAPSSGEADGAPSPAFQKVLLTQWRKTELDEAHLDALVSCVTEAPNLAAVSGPEQGNAVLKAIDAFKRGEYLLSYGEGGAPVFTAASESVAS